MPENNENKNLQEQREKFLRELDLKEKMIDEQLNNLNKDNSPVVLPPVKKKVETIEEQRKRFLKELDVKDKELDKTIAYENSLKGSNLTRRKQQSVQDKMKFNFYKTLVGAVVIIIVVVGLCKFFVGQSFEETMSTTTTHNTNQVKFALINYYEDHKKLPIDSNSKIDTKALIKGDYLHTDVEKQCNCSFYLKDDKQTVLAIPKSKK